VKNAAVVRALMLRECGLLFDDTDPDVTLAGQGVGGSKPDDAATDDRYVRHLSECEVSRLTPYTTARDRLQADLRLALLRRPITLRPRRTRLTVPAMKRSVLTALVFVFAACGTGVEVDFGVAVVNVDTVQAQDGIQVVCDVVITATAVGDNGVLGRFGEADFTFRSVATGQTLRTESVSSAFVSTQFDSQVIEAGTSLQSRVLQRPAGEAFHWDFEFFYRNPAGARSSVETTSRCG